jgi:hypothetical protein
MANLFELGLFVLAGTLPLLVNKRAYKPSRSEKSFEE